MCCSAAGVPARPDVLRVHAQLHTRQRALLWAAARRALQEEETRAAAGPGTSGHELIAHAMPKHAGSGAMGPLLLGLYLQSVDGARPPLCKPQDCALINSRMFQFIEMPPTLKTDAFCHGMTLVTQATRVHANQVA